MRTFAIYKGLQKPLVYKGFKGRYMYWTIGFILLAIVLAGLIGALVHFAAGIVSLVVIAGGGIFYTSRKQKDGLYDKVRHRGIYVFQTNLRGARHVKKEPV